MTRNPLHELQRDASRYLVGLGVHNALTARLAGRAGFDLLWLSSFEVSAAKGMPDVNLVTPIEMADLTAEITASSDLPLLVDADNGYGSDELAMRAAHRLAGAGAAGICLEDNEFPKRCSLYEGIERSLMPAEWFAQRLRCVRAAAPQLFLIARTEALVAGHGADAAVARARAYVAAGADAVFLQFQRPAEAEARRAIAALAETVPVVLAPTVLETTTAGELHELGARVVIYANVVVRALIASLAEILPRLREKELLAEVRREIAPLDEVFRITEAGRFVPELAEPKPEV